MFVSKRERNKEAGYSVAELLDGAIPSLCLLAQNAVGVTLRGLSVNPSREGEGFLAIVRVTVDATEASREIAQEIRPGHYVVYGHGADVFEALAMVEAALQLGEATLSVDKYARD